MSINKKPAKPVAEAAVAAPAAVAPVAAVDFAKPVAQFQETVRAQTEAGINQARETYADLKAKAEFASAKLDESIKAAQAGAQDVNAKAVASFKAHTDANLAHAKALMAVKSFSDVVTLQQAYFKALAEAFQSEAKDFAALSQRIANDVAEPVKASFAAAIKR